MTPEAKARLRKKYRVYRQPLQDPAITIARIEYLRSKGATLQTIADAAGLTRHALTEILSGDVKKVTRATQAAILAARPVTVTRQYVDATGTRRRLRGLVALGWNQTELAHRAATDRAGLGKIVLGDQMAVTADLAARVRDLYDELSMTHAPESRAAKYARTVAGKYGWVPPLAWDDDTIDDPSATPEGIAA